LRESDEAGLERALPWRTPEFRRREIESIDHPVAVRIREEGVGGPPVEARNLVEIGEAVPVRVRIGRIGEESEEGNPVPLLIIPEAVPVGVRGDRGGAKE